MKFFIDTANLKMIQEAQDLGILDGVTTNPSLMAKEGISGSENIINHYKKVNLLKEINGLGSIEEVTQRIIKVITLNKLKKQIIKVISDAC